MSTTRSQAQSAPRFASLAEAVQAGAIAPEVVTELQRTGSVRTILRVDETLNQKALAAATEVTQAAAQREPAPAAGPASTSDGRLGAPTGQDGGPLPDRPTLNRELNTVRTAAIAAGGSGVRETRRFVAMPLSAVEVTSEAGLLRLANAPQTGSIALDEKLTTQLNETLPFIGQPAAVAAGLTGAGTVVGVLDTGVDYTRAAFGSCSSPGVPAACRVGWTQDFAPDDFVLDEGSFHGTNVSGIVAGVAPGAKLAVGDVFDGSGAFTSDIISGLSWLEGLRSGGVNVVAVNLSLGGSLRYTANCSDSYGFSTLLSFGIQPVVASGNSAYQSGVYIDGISSPACIAGAISVGRVYDGSNPGGWIWGSSPNQCTDYTSGADKIVCSSQSAPILTMLAPGSFVTAAGVTQSGTSQASPHVAGEFAAVRGCRPERSMTQALSALTVSGTALIDPRTGRTTPRLRMDTLPAVLAPSNDHQSNPTAISVPTTLTTTVCAATSDGGEPAHGGVAAARSVWYRFSVFPATGVAIPHPSGVRVAVYLDGTDASIPAETCSIAYATPCDAFTLSRGTYNLAVDADSGVTSRFSVQVATYAVASDVRVVTPPAPLASASATRGTTPPATPASILARGAAGSAP